MIGSHDSFTYLKSTKWAMNLITRFWRCQDQNIVEQYNNGCRFFDVRVCRDKVSRKKVWRAAHGAAKLSIYWGSIEELCQWMEAATPEAVYRIWFESGSNSEYNDWRTECLAAAKRHPKLVQLYRKNPETKVYQAATYPSGNYPAGMTWYTFDKWTASNVAKMIFGKAIKDFANANNPRLSKSEELENTSKCYFMDFCTNWQK